ncbi:DUF4398 domain-containing protein [Bowmanella yangjiangensis]|uniref:DUF4398 domain-containing protein n=1 Tax=Bowmanella yangjiangensis TaxID=2811230 RepID=A0ABS3CMQ8_9ALTE|nr:DUF4398 domain-containing protein [Bowmanella yangjiangensis]MBN7818393.1 DUF4398 domain-containing protein [Bowmanella yangjiangensis]
MEKICGVFTPENPRRCVRQGKLTVLAILLYVSACVTQPPSPDLIIEEVKQGLVQLQQSDLPLSASELMQAQQLLNQAKYAQERKQIVVATRLAERARLIAQLALAKASLHQAEVLNDELRTRIDLLRLARQHSNGIRP